MATPINFSFIAHTNVLERTLVFDETINDVHIRVYIEPGCKDIYTITAEPEGLGIIGFGATFNYFNRLSKYVTKTATLALVDDVYTATLKLKCLNVGTVVNVVLTPTVEP